MGCFRRPRCAYGTVHATPRPASPIFILPALLHRSRATKRSCPGHRCLYQHSFTLPTPPQIPSRAPFDCPHIPQRKTRFQQFRIGLGNELKSRKCSEIIRARKNRVSLKEVSRNCSIIYNILMHPTQALFFPPCAHSHPYAPSNVQDIPQLDSLLNETP